MTRNLDKVFPSRQAAPLNSIPSQGQFSLLRATKLTVWVEIWVVGLSKTPKILDQNWGPAGHLVPVCWFTHYLDCLFHLWYAPAGQILTTFWVAMLQTPYLMLRVVGTSTTDTLSFSPSFRLRMYSYIYPFFPHNNNNKTLNIKYRHTQPNICVPERWQGTFIHIHVALCPDRAWADSFVVCAGIYDLPLQPVSPGAAVSALLGLPRRSAKN